MFMFALLPATTSTVRFDVSSVDSLKLLTTDMPDEDSVRINRLLFATVALRKSIRKLTPL